MGALLCRCCAGEPDEGPMPLISEPAWHALANSNSRSAASSAAVHRDQQRRLERSSPEQRSALDPIKVSQLQHVKLKPATLEEERLYRSLSMSSMEPFLPECLICLDEFAPGAPCVSSVCGCGENRHLFHGACLSSWKQACRDKGLQALCPICSMDIHCDEL
jgi:hypothetical protein